MCIRDRFIPIAVVACTWFPLFYGYKIIYAAAVGDVATLAAFGKLIGYVLLFAFYLPFMLQTLLAAALERKKLNVPFRKLLPAIFLSPLFMIVYAISICLGVFSRPSWKKIKRNVVSEPVPDVSEEGAAAEAALPASPEGESAPESGPAEAQEPVPADGTGADS